MAPALSKFLQSSTLAVLVERKVALTACGFTLLLWLASVHRNNENRKYRFSLVLRQIGWCLISNFLLRDAAAERVQYVINEVGLQSENVC